MTEKLTTTELAEKVGLSDIRIRQMILSGEIYAYKKGRDWMIDESYVELIKNRPEKRGRRLKKAA